MPILFRDGRTTIQDIERWQERKRQVQATADSVTPEQAVNISRLARMFPFISPGVVRTLGQAGLGPDDKATQFAVTQELLRNYSTTGSWSGQLGKQQRALTHPTTTMPEGPKRPKYPQSGAEAGEFFSQMGAVNRHGSMEQAQDLLKRGETLGVFNPTTQMLVEPDFGDNNEPSEAYKVFTRLQDLVYSIAESPVPYLSRDGVIRGYTPLSGTTGDRELNIQTGEPILPEDQPDPTILGKYYNESGVGGSLGRLEDYGRNQQQADSASIISQIFAGAEQNVNLAGTRDKAMDIFSKHPVTAAGMAALPSVAPAIRGFATAADAPIQEIAGQVRNVYGAMHGEDVDWLRSQSDLGIALPKLIRGQEVDLGTGLFVDPESAVARERRDREAELGQIGGHNLSIGRIIANGVGAEPDSKAFLIMSGLVDGAAQLADPTAFGLGAGAKISKARKMFSAADETGGAFRGIRGIVHGPTAETFLNKNTALIETLAKTDSAYEIGKLTRFKLGPEITGTLSRIKDPADVRRFIDASVARAQISRPDQLKPSWSVLHDALQPIASRRMFGMLPHQTFDLEDSSQVADNLVRVMRNAHADEADIADVYNKVAKARNKNDLRDAVLDSQSRVGGLLDRYGIKDPEFRSALTRTNRETYVEDLRGHIDEAGADVPIWDTIGVDGIPTKIPGPHLPLEHIGRFMSIPDQRAIRRLTTKYNFLTASQTDIPLLTSYRAKQLKVAGRTVKQGKAPKRNIAKIGEARWPIAGIDYLMSDILKPSWLLRLAWPVRVIGEEQLRMAGAGLDSMTKHPISYFATVIGGDQNKLARMVDKMSPGLKGRLDISPSGELFAETEQLAAVTYRSHGGWLDQPGTVRSRVPQVFNKNNPAELADWRSSWSHELALLHHDPVSNYISQHNFEDSVQWLYRGGGNGYRRELMSGHPGNLETNAQVRAYVQTITDDIARSTQGHPDLIEVVQKGKFSTFHEGQETSSAIFRDKPTINPDFTEHLKGYQEIGPEKIKGRANLTFEEGHKFPARWGAGVDRFMSLLMGTPTSTLSRSPAFRQFVWQRTAEILPYANTAARVDILANAKKAGLNARQMRTLERAAGRGKKALVEPAIPKGMIRLYRGTRPIKPGATKIYGERAGRFFTTNKSFASQYGELHYIDVDASDGLVAALGPKANDLKGKAEIVVPKGFERQMKPLMSETRFTGVLNTDDVDMLAKGHALDDTKELLYDLSERSQITDILRNIVPFGEAWKEVITRWAKLATFSGPGGIPLPAKPVRRFQQVVQGARGEDLGSLMGTGIDPETGKQRGFWYQNEFGQEVFAYPGSEWLTKTLSGAMGGAPVPIPLTGSVQGLNMFGTIIPGLGPVAQIPVGWFIQDKPEYDEWREQLLPFGAPGSTKVSDLFSMREYLPAWAKTAIDIISDGGTNERAWATSVMYTASYLYSTGEYGDSVDEQSRLMEDAKDSAKDVYWVRMLGQFMLPASPQFDWMTKDKDGRLLNTRILAEEYYESLETMNPDEAVADFLDKYGPNAIGAIVPKSRATISAIPVSLEGAKWVSSHPGVKKDYPLVYGFFAPQGEFHQATYQRGYVTNEREGITPEQWLNLRDTLMGNYHYNRAKDMLGEDRNSPNQEQSDWLLKQRKQVAEAYPNWNNKVGLEGKASDDNDRVIAQMYEAVKNRSVKNTDAGKGLALYLPLRDAAMAKADELGHRSFKTANDMASTRQWLSDNAHKIIARHPDFERIWDIVFHREMEDAVLEPSESRRTP